MARVREGKTKRVTPIEAVILKAKDDLTAYNGKRHELLPGKGELATRTTVNLFELLRHCGFPLAYIAQEGSDSFYAFDCDMLPLEVVVRGKAYGSFLRRNSAFSEGDELDPPIVEFYLKTKNKEWRGHALSCDDPYLIVDKETIHLYDPDQPITSRNAMLALPLEEVFEPWMVVQFEEIAKIAAEVYFVLRAVFALFKADYADMKLEFGMSSHKGLVIADVIDSDSGRLLFNGKHKNKQVFRDGGSLAETLEVYEWAADLTDRLKYHYEQALAALRSALVKYQRAFLR